MSQLPKNNNGKNESQAIKKGPPSEGGYMGTTLSMSAQASGAFRGATSVISKPAGLGMVGPPMAFGKGGQAMGPPLFGSLGAGPKAFPQMNAPMQPLEKSFGPMDNGVPVKPMMELQIEPQVQAVGSNMEAEIWEGPLSPFNCFNSKQTPKELSTQVDTKLQDMVTQKLVDFELKNFELIGRMYHHNDMSEFRITIFQATDNRFKSVLEIRRSTGDSFVHDELHRAMVDELTKSGSIENEAEEEFAAFQFPMLGFGGFDDLPDADTVMSDMQSEDDASSTATDDSVIKLTEEYINIVTDRQSYRDMYRHAAGALVSQLEMENVVEKIESEENIVTRLLEPLTQDLYDTLIIVSVLQVLEKLFSRGSKSGLSVPSGTQNSLEELKNTWSEGVDRNLGPMTMRFVRSQQIVHWSNRCLEALR